MTEDAIVDRLKRRLFGIWAPNRRDEIAGALEEVREASISEQGVNRLIESMPPDLTGITGTVVQSLVQRLEGIREEKIREQSMTNDPRGASKRPASDFDPVTGLLSRGVLNSEFPRIFTQLATDGRPLSMIMIDIDNFKKINDTHGHPTGDAVLAAVGQQLARVVAQRGSVYRYGGEEILVLLPDYTQQESLSLAERARIEVERLNPKGIKVTASFGIAVYPDHAEDTEQLLSKADSAMYDAKKRGRNLVRVFGEPAPVEVVGEQPKRRLPDTGKLTEAEMEDIRTSYFRTGGALCPRDEAILTISELNALGMKQPGLMIWCKLCGLAEQIPGSR